MARTIDEIKDQAVDLANIAKRAAYDTGATPSAIAVAVAQMTTCTVDICERIE